VRRMAFVPMRDQNTLRAVQIEAGLTQALNSKFFSPDKVAEYFRLRFRGQTLVRPRQPNRGERAAVSLSCEVGQGCKQVACLGQTFLSASWGEFPVAPRPNWKVRRTGRLESPPHSCLTRIRRFSTSEFRVSRLDRLLLRKARSAQSVRRVKALVGSERRLRNRTRRLRKSRAMG
jgi:hypothetical protein